MGIEVLVGHEWISAEESDTEIMEALESIEQRGGTARLRDRWVLLTTVGEKRRVKVAPEVIHAIREPRSQSN